jgi:hypothetical protein
MKNQNAPLETLESRMLMSAAPLVQPGAHHTTPARPGIHVPSSHPMVSAGAAVVHKTTPVKATAKAVTPAEPATTDPSITYKSFAGDPLFAPAGPTISDVNQGYVGDCFLLSTLSSVAKTDPALIRQDVVANANGTFNVTFGGKKGTTETVDAELPVWPDGQVAYAGLGAGNSLWVAVTEKAYAIYKSGKNASYNAINGGWMGDAFAALGLKSTNIFTEPSAAALASALRSELAAGDFVTVGTTSTVPAASPLVAGHAYEVDAVVTTNGVVTGITMRNPWGDAVANDGYVTVTPAQAMAVFGGAVISRA